MAVARSTLSHQLLCPATPLHPVQTLLGLADISSTLPKHYLDLELNLAYLHHGRLELLPLRCSEPTRHISCMSTLRSPQMCILQRWPSYVLEFRGLLELLKLGMVSEVGYAAHTTSDERTRQRFSISINDDTWQGGLVHMVGRCWVRSTYCWTRYRSLVWG